MEYQERYNYFYSKYYTKAEFLIKQYLIKKNSQERVFTLAFNEVTQYLTNNHVQKKPIYTHQDLKSLHLLFENRGRFYAKTQVKNIFENEIKIAFNAISKSLLPNDYNFTKLVIEIAILEATNEIARVFSNHFQLINMFYQLNEFELFEIRTYDPLNIEDSPIYKKLQKQLYPKSNVFFDADSIINSNQQNDKTTGSNFNRNHWNENCFQLFYYLENNYNKKGKIKYINIFYFLKNNVDKNKYAFAFTIEQYKDFIQTNFDIQLIKFEKAEYEYVEKVIPILSGFEQDFRKK